MSTIFTDHQKRISRFSIGITPLDDAALKSVNGGFAVTTAVLLATGGAILGAINAYARTRKS